MPRKHDPHTDEEALDEWQRRAPKHVTDDISELLAGYALNALSSEDAAFIERYLELRPAWQAELARYERASLLLAYAAPVQQVPVRARAGVLARIDALAIESQEEALARSQPAPAIWLRLRNRKRNVPKIAWAAALPTTLLAIVLIMSSIIMQDRISDQRGQLAEFQQEQSKATDVLLGDNSSGRDVVDLVETRAAPFARGRLYVNRADNTAMLVVRNMPRPDEGQVYVVWVSTNTVHEEYARLGALDVDDLGRAQKILDPPDSFDRYLNVRITIEESDDVGIPTGPEVMTGGI